MKYHIEKQDTGITIRIDDVGGQEQTILEAIRQCRRQSAWACPSAECQYIGSMEERAGDGSVFLTLTPSPGMQLGGEPGCCSNSCEDSLVAVLSLA